MPRWTTLTLAEARAATKVEILQNVGQYLNDHFTKRQIIFWLWDLEEGQLVPDKPSIVYRPDRQVGSRETIFHDLVTGAKRLTRRVVYSYYTSGEVDEIVLTRLDENDVEVSRKTIKHFLDGRQPEETVT